MNVLQPAPVLAPSNPPLVPVISAPPPALGNDNEKKDKGKENEDEDEDEYKGITEEGIYSLPLPSSSY